MKWLVLYKSISGFTKQYAQWIADQLSAQCLTVEHGQKINLDDYDLVIFGGSLHAVGINGFKQFKKVIPQIGATKVVVFAVGASPAKDGIVAEVRSANLAEQGLQSIPLFYLRGGFDYSKLDFKNKVLMTLLKWKLSLKKEKSPDELGMLHAYSMPLDTTRPKNIEPLIAYVRDKFMAETAK